MIKALLFLVLFMPAIVKADSALNAEEFNKLIVNEQSPFVFSPNNINENDFEIISTSAEIQAKIAPKSFEWTRVEKQHVFPRARVQVTDTKDASRVLMIQYSLFTSFKEVMMALTTHSEAIVLDQDGKTELARLKVHYKPKKNYKNKAVIDTSCSPYGVEVTEDKLLKSWVALSCKLYQTESITGTKPMLELLIYWDNGNEALPVSINGQMQPAPAGLIYPIRLSAEQSSLVLKRGDEEVVLKQKIPPVYHRLSVSAGIGPYLYHVEELGQSFTKWIPYGTVYAAYGISDSVKIASFWAFPIDKKFQTDIGFYLITEQFRGIDERVSLNLLLGAHVLHFSGADKNHFTFSAPQGLELNFRDLFGKQKSLSLGGFFYPTISGRSYVNSWARIGTSFLFYELNFIAWREPYDVGPVNSKSVGFSLGFPLFRLL